MVEIFMKYGEIRKISQTIFTGKTYNAITVYYILEQPKETILGFSKGTTRVL